MNRIGGLGWFVTMGLVALLLAHIVVLAGDPALERHRRSGRTAQVHWPRDARGRGGPLVAAQSWYDLELFRFGHHPFVIALTAPARWARPRLHALRTSLRWLLRSRSARRRGWGGGHEGLFPDDPGLGGVREPRRPRPMPPTDSVALRPPARHSTHE